MPRFSAPLLAFGLFFCIPAAHAEDSLAPVKFQSQGPFGTIDKAAAQRGYEVFETSCASCHSISQLHYRDLQSIGLTPEQATAEALANGATLDSPLKGAAPMDMGGAVPPDLSNIVTQRAGGTRYIYDYLTGYAAAPAGLTLLPGHFYDSAFPGGQTAMPNPLHDGGVTYADGVAASTAQQAADVAEFLTFTADPNLDVRNKLALRALIFFGFLAIVAVFAKRNVWRAQG